MSLRRSLFDAFDGDLTEDKQLAVGQELKDEDEIRRFTVSCLGLRLTQLPASQIAEGISEQEKALMFLNGGHPTQQLWTIERYSAL